VRAIVEQVSSSSATALTTIINGVRVVRGVVTASVGGEAIGTQGGLFS
jgi:hypothetical protein